MFMHITSAYLVGEVILADNFIMKLSDSCLYTVLGKIMTLCFVHRFGQCMETFKMFDLRVHDRLLIVNCSLY